MYTLGHSLQGMEYSNPFCGSSGTGSLGTQLAELLNCMYSSSGSRPNRFRVISWAFILLSSDGVGYFFLLIQHLHLLIICSVHHHHGPTLVRWQNEDVLITCTLLQNGMKLSHQSSVTPTVWIFALCARCDGHTKITIYVVRMWILGDMSSSSIVERVSSLMSSFLLIYILFWTSPKAMKVCYMFDSLFARLCPHVHT